MISSGTITVSAGLPPCIFICSIPTEAIMPCECPFKMLFSNFYLQSESVWLSGGSHFASWTNIICQSILWHFLLRKVQNGCCSSMRGVDQRTSWCANISDTWCWQPFCELSVQQREQMTIKWLPSRYMARNIKKKKYKNWHQLIASKKLNKRYFYIFDAVFMGRSI